MFTNASDAPKGGDNMAPKTNTEEVVETEVTEAEEIKGITPKALATELGIDPKRLRAYLRSNHARPDEAHRSRWDIPQDVADAARERFTASDEDEAEDES